MASETRHLPRAHTYARVGLDDPDRLAAVRRLLPVGADNPVVTRLVALASHLLETTSAHVSLVAGSTAVVGGYGAGTLLAGGPPVPREESLCAHVASRGVPLLVHDATREGPELARLLGVGEAWQTLAYLGVPLIGGTGMPVGAVCVYDERPRRWDSRDVMVVEELAEAVGAELERTAVEAERNDAQRVLHEVGRDHEQALVALVASASDLLAASLEPDEAVRSLVRLTVPGLADWSVVTLVDDHGQPRDVEWWHRDPDAFATIDEFARHRFDGLTELPDWLASIADRGHYRVEVGVLAAARQMLASPRAVGALTRLAPASMLVVPIAGRGRVDGTITLFRGAGRPPMSEAEIAAAGDIGRRASVALGNAREYSHQRTTSEQLQRSLLTAPVVPAGAELEVRYSPATDGVHVGGDWYDAFALPCPDVGVSDGSDDGMGDGSDDGMGDGGGTMLVVGDVAGHDVAAAAAMGQVRSIVRGLAVTSCASPAVLLDEVDRALERLRLDIAATALVCRLGAVRADGAELTWSSAGHLPALLLGPDGVVRPLDADGVMLGLGGAGPRTEQTVTVPPGSTLLLYTDGLVERRREGLDAGLARLRATAGPLADRPLPELVDRLLGEMLPGEHEDDVAVLAVRLRPQ